MSSRYGNNMPSMRGSVKFPHGPKRRSPRQCEFLPHQRNPVFDAEWNDLVIEIIKWRVHGVRRSALGHAVADEHERARPLLQHERKILAAGDRRSIRRHVLGAYQI